MPSLKENRSEINCVSHFQPPSSGWKIMGFEVLVVVAIKITSFWDVIPINLICG
jgi:hypothetical protein